MEDILKMGRVQIVVIILFAFFKAIRKGVLANNPSEFIQIFLLSFPNFCEGVIGVLTLTILGLLINRRLRFKNEIIYLLATVLATIYVVTQELKIHNLGGKNVYDPNDLIFSIIGLIVGYIIVCIINPRIQTNSSTN